MSSTPLSTLEIKTSLHAVPDWSRKGGVIRREFEFSDFKDAIRFVGRVAKVAERAGHHPDIDVRWNRVSLALTTHDAGGLTMADFELAHRVDALFEPAE